MMFLLLKSCAYNAVIYVLHAKTALTTAHHVTKPVHFSFYMKTHAMRHASLGFTGKMEDVNHV